MIFRLIKSYENKNVSPKQIERLHVCVYVYAGVEILELKTKILGLALCNLIRMGLAITSLRSILSIEARIESKFKMWDEIISFKMV